MLLAASERLGVEPRQMLMVGDSEPDMRSAQAAGCPAMLVTWGYGHEKLGGWPASQRVATPEHLLQTLRTSRADSEPICNS